jgi:hypothetical protein
MTDRQRALDAMKSYRWHMFNGTQNVEVFDALEKTINAALSQPDLRDGMAKAVAEQQDEEKSGFWNNCSGCLNSEDGHHVADYPYSEIFKCYVGSGCGECGGLGVVWDNVDYEQMANDMQ